MDFLGVIRLLLEFLYYNFLYPTYSHSVSLIHIEYSAHFSHPAPLIFLYLSLCLSLFLCLFQKPIKLKLSVEAFSLLTFRQLFFPFISETSNPQHRNYHRICFRTYAEQYSSTTVYLMAKALVPSFSSIQPEAYIHICISFYYMPISSLCFIAFHLLRLVSTYRKPKPKRKGAAFCMP